MELSTIKDAFDRVAKKQNISTSKTQEVIDRVSHETEQALAKLQSTMTTEESSCIKSILDELNTKLTDIGPINQIEASQKELNVALSKYAKLIEKAFIPDIAKSYRNVEFDTQIINQIIATHFYRQGLFDLGDCFIAEAGMPDSSTLEAPFLEMYQILEELKAKNLEPSLKWVSTNRDRLMQTGSTLELKLHRLQFVEILKKGNGNEALQYVRTYLAPFATVHMMKIQKLMACLLWVGRLDSSPYAELLSRSHWDELETELTPVTIAVGTQGLPTLLKLASVMAAKRQEWQALKQLPVPVELGSEFQFHSIFVCPVSRDQGTEENPPTLLPCGHVLCKQSILKLSKSSTRSFKCPYCPLDANVAHCKQFISDCCSRKMYY